MDRTPLWDRIEPLLPFVEGPSRYIDHEYHATHKGDMKDAADLYRAALLYPDTYELGQSNQAVGILYKLINAQQGALAERVYLPWIDMIDLMREKGIPLFTLESSLPVASFDLFGITLPHELAATNILEAFDLAGIPLRSKDRRGHHPVVLGGGPVAFNPEPLAPFFDAFLIGEGEEAIVEIIDRLKSCKKRNLTRKETLAALAAVEGVYVPALYEPDESGVLVPVLGRKIDPVKRRVVKDFSTYDIITDPVVPFSEVTHDRLNVEILRGCTRGCRFCQAGMVYRPVRERPADRVVEAVACGLKRTGYDEVSLTSLSSTDHSQIAEILRRLNHLTFGTDVSLSIPSQRLDAFGVDMAQAVAQERKGGLTFAPEAGTQRLRDCINKNVTEDDLVEAIRAAFEAGWRRCKLYFMIGLPTERDEDVRGIAQLANLAYATAKDAVSDKDRQGVRISVSVAVFIPKPHTPFQWVGQIPQVEIERRIELLRSAGLHKAISLHWHDPATSLIEAALSRSGRQAADLIEVAWRLGARFDAWSEQFRQDAWIKAAEDCGIDIEAWAQRSFEFDEHLYWDHIDSGISKAFLAAENKKSEEGITSADCSFGLCTGCNACDSLGSTIRLGGKRRG